MTSYLIKRLLLMLLTMFGICLVSFVVINLAPGDPADKSSAPGAGGGAENQAISDIVLRKNRERLFLDKPILFNKEPSNRESIARTLIKDLLSDDKYVVKDVLEKGRLVDMGTVALPTLIKALDAEPVKQELSKRKTVLKALKKVTGHWDISESDARATGSPVARSKAWKEFWSKNSQQFNESEARKAVVEFFKAPDTSEAQSKAKKHVLYLGAWTLPPLMARYESSSGEERQRVAQIMSTVARKPWDLTTTPKELGNFRANWANKVAEILNRVDDAVSKAKLKGLKKLGQKKYESLTAVFSDLAEHEKTSDKTVQKRVRVAKSKLVTLGDRKDFVAAQTQRDLDDHQRGWRNWWERKEENLVVFGGSDSFTRMFTDTRFGHWLSKLLVLDFGESYTTNRPVLEMIKERFPVTFKMNLVSLLLTYLIAIPIGIYSSTHQYSTTDRVTTILLFVLYSLPTFWVGTMMIWLLTGPPYLDWFPSSHAVSADYESMTTVEAFWDQVWHLTLPVLCLTYGGVAYISRQMRAGMLETIRQDYIRTARAKGLSEDVVIFKHALRNSLIPIVTLLANLLPLMIGGSVIIEQIFSIEGLGNLSFQAVLNRDYPVIMTIFTFSGFLTLLGILLSDITYALVDPRITYS